MTATAELERVARDIVPPVGATAWRITERGSAADGSTIYAVVPIIGGRIDGVVVYRGAQDDVRRMHDLLVGRRASTSRKPAQAAVAVSEPAPEAPQPLTSAGRTGVGSIPRADASGERTPGGASIARLCAGCDEPLPPDAGAQRTTHDGACRIAAFRKRQGDLAKATSAAQTANGRARDRGIEGLLTPEDILDLWAVEPVCNRCGEGRGVDHISPLEAGGANARSNLQTLCVSCNSKKAAGERIPARAAENRDALALRANSHVVTPSRASTGPAPRPAAAEPAPTVDGLHRQPDQQLTEAPARNPGASTPTASVPDRATSVRGVEAQLRDPSGAP